MDTTTNIIQNTTPSANLNKKKKCLTNSEYNALANWIDSLIKDNTDFILNKYDLLKKKVASEFSHINNDTLLSIIDTRVQVYVRQHHHKAFNHTSNTNSPLRSSITPQPSATTTPNQSPIHHQAQRNRRSVNSSSTMYDRYKELVTGDLVPSPLVTLANNLRMPAMLVAKIVLSDQMHDERVKKELNRQQQLNNENNLSSGICNGSSGILTDSNLPNDNNPFSMSDSGVNSLAANELDTSTSVDAQLSQQLKWLTNKIISMQKVVPVDPFNQSANSSINSNSYSAPMATKEFTSHQLASSTWLIHSDPQLAYQVYKCSVVDGFYGPCIDFIKSCTGKRYEQLLKQSMDKKTWLATDTKSQTNRSNRNSLYITEKECRLRGLDMTPDMVLNEPIALLLSNDDGVKDNQEHEFTATSYIGGSDNAVRVLNWIESKAMFGGPEQMRTVMQRQLFPYWNRYGPGAVIYWFGHVLEDNENDQGGHTSVSTDKPNDVSAKADTTELSAFNFWSKYCVLMDGFPAFNRIVMHHRNNNRQNCIKKKNSTTTQQ